GNVSTQISKLDPLNREEVIWYLRPQEVLTIGRLFITGKYDAAKIYALTGPGVKKPSYFKSLDGACIVEMVKDNITEGKKRFISGNVLTGKKIIKEGYVDFYDSQVTVVPEGDYYEFIGWALPGLNKFSFYHQFFSWLWPKKKYNLDTNLHGGERAFVMTGKFEQVFPFDIYPMQLVKAIMIEDIDQMENLGIYEIDDEDFALCEFIDTSKTEIQTIVRDGLDLMRKEMM
ncbi:MAG: NADH:ubiquinone reductase (Na(+)-transporting) subunit A, partial [Bacteroidota bacterium]|nr:NADH:ubiquinone reductase (Na(+)-transporting) subunit A [Bacteroidota bacterium]